MKTRGIRTILYSIVTALILSAISLLLVPRMPFKGDARWTYQNDAARVDVKFNGHLKNARVDAAGADLKVSQPAWLSKESYQGTMIEFPVSYRTKSYQLKLSPKADEWGRDAVLVVELKGKDFQHRGKRRAAWVCFRNISLNGQCVAGEKVVWHNKPFVFKYPLHSSPELTLTFDVCKPLATSDISFKNLLAVFFACLLLCLFFAPLKRAVDHVLTFTNQKDVVRILSDSYRNIDPVYRRSFWIIFGVLCFAFGFHTICFMWGNHDWSLLEFQQRWLRYTGLGRYMVCSVKSTFLHGVYLPLVYDVITFVAMAINAVLLCKYWHLEKRVVYYVLCGLVLTVQPFTLGMLYFINMIPEVFIGVTCVLTALILSEKIAVTKVSLPRKILYSLIAIVLVNCALATYPVLISTIAVAFVGKLLILSFAWDGAMRSLKSYLMPFVVSVTNIAIGVVSYKLMTTFVFPLKAMYNTETLRLEEIPERLDSLFKRCFHQLYEYNSPFITQWILWIFLGFTILLALYVCATGNFKQKIVRLVLLFGSLFGTQTAMVIAKTYITADRVELFGFVPFEVLVMVLVLTRLRKLRNISVVAGTCAVFASVINDLDCLRVWKLGFDAEKMLWNRVLARLEIQKDFSPSRKYNIVQIGHSISLRPRFYTGQSKKFIGDAKPILYFSYDSEFYLFRAYELYYPTRFRREGFTAYYGNKAGYEARLKRLYQAGVLQKAEVWPKPNGLIVWKDIILFVTDGKELEKYKRKFERELRRK